MRSFKYSHLSYAKLSENPYFNFAKDFCLIDFKTRSVFTFIPKNGCTSLRTSLAISNGFIPDIKHLDWIHNNNTTMTCSLLELFNAPSASIILRCPFERIASCFFDKFTIKRINSDFYDAYINSDPNIYSFIDFLKSLTLNSNLLADIHWIPQVSYLLFDDYDNYYNLKDDNLESKIFDTHGLIFYDTRKYSLHNTSNLKLNGNFSENAHLSITEITIMRNNYELPSYESIYNSEAIELVNQIYADDIKFFKDKFGDSSTLF
jgi:hypothetical protein